MTTWQGDELDSSDREEAMGQFSADAIDREFLPYIDRINVLPFVTTTQSCAGHLGYDAHGVPEDERPTGASGHWGYLQVMLTLEAVHWLCRKAVAWRWLWVSGSQLFIDGASPPGVTDNESYVITFAWDASHWPIPALDIATALEELYSEGLGEV